MSNLLTRRLALFRIASASAVAATVSAPVALAAVLPKNPENPTLLRLGQKITKLDAIRRYRAKVLADAKAAYEATRPELPQVLLATRQSERLADSEKEVDCEGKPVWPSDPTKQPRRHHTADAIQRALARWDGEEDLEPHEQHAKELLTAMLPVAERYEQEEENARQQCNVLKALSAHHLAGYAVETLGRRIAEVPAQTPDGITIKAAAYEAWAAVDEEAAYRAALIIGPGMASDVCRVLSEGGEA